MTDLAEPISAAALRALDARGLRARLGDDAALTLPDEDWYAGYLRAVGTYPPGTPMACDWRVIRGPGVNRRELWVHLVKFH